MFYHVSKTLKTMILVTCLACGNSPTGPNTIGPANQLEVANASDTFEFQVSALDDVTQTLSYTWTITGPEATVDIAGALTAGTATVTIMDDQGVEVFSSSLNDSNNTNTNAGIAGTWTI